MLTTRKYEIIHRWILSVVAFMVPLYFLLTLPPNFNFIDSMAMLIPTTPLEVNLLQYAPLYPFFLKKSVALLTFPFLSSFDSVKGFVNDRGLYLTIIVQYVLLVSSLVYLACGLGRTFKKQLLALSVFLLNAVFFLYVHGLYSESLWIPLLLFQLGAIYRLIIVRERMGVPYLVYCVALFFQLLTRHIGIVLAPLLPILVLATIAVDAKKRRDFYIKQLGFFCSPGCQYFLLALFLTLLPVLAARSTQKIVLMLNHIEDRSLAARPMIYRLSAIPWDKVGELEKERVIGELINRTDDPIVKKAIPAAFSATNPWEETWWKVNQVIKKDFREETRFVDTNVLTDRVLNKIAWLFLTSGNRYLWESIFKDFKTYLNSTSSQQAVGILDNSKNSLVLYEKSEFYRNFLNNVESVNIKNLPLFDNFIHHPYIRLLKPVKESWLAFFIFLFSIFFLKAKLLKKDVFIMINVSLFFAAAYLGLISFLTIFIFRYSVFGSLLIFFALSVLVSNISKEEA